MSSSVTALERRTLRVLVAAQIVGGAGFFVGLAVIALLARDLSGSDTASGLAPALAVLASALAAIPLSALMDRRGRRPGLALGYAVGAVGTAVVLAAAAADSFGLYCAGVALFGVAYSSALLSRYAGADLSPAERRARAMSTVLFATAAGAILGPNLASLAEGLGDPLGVPDRAGPFAVSGACFVLATGVLLALLRPDPLLASRSEAGGSDDAAAVSEVPLRDQLLSGPAALGICAMLTANIVMVGIMTMTPIQLVDHGQTLTVVGVVLSVHVAGMFLPSPITGHLSDRLGRLPVIRASAVVLAVSGTVAAFGHESTVLVGVALALLGVGWNLGLVGGSALLTDSIAPAVRARAQGFADLAMGLAGAVGSVSSGVVLGAGGFALLASLGAGLAMVLLAVSARGRIEPRPV
jgi:MFS family permease